MGKNVINLRTVKKWTYPRSFEWTVNAITCIPIKDRQRTFGTAAVSLCEVAVTDWSDVTTNPATRSWKRQEMISPEALKGMQKYWISDFYPLEFWDSTFQVSKRMYQPDPSLTKFPRNFPSNGSIHWWVWSALLFKSNKMVLCEFPYSFPLY